MKREHLASWLKCVTLAAALMLLALLAILLPSIGQELSVLYPELSSLYWPCLIWSWALGLIIFIALGLFWQICTRIHNDNSFCLQNAKALCRISQLALADTLLGFGLLVYLSISAHLHPTMLLFFIVLLLAGVAISIAAALLSRLVEKAAQLKEENDLTV